MFLQNYLVFASYYLMFFLTKVNSSRLDESQSVDFSDLEHDKPNISEIYNETRIVHIQNNFYLKGYPLRIPKHQNLSGEESTSDMTQIIEQDVRRKRGVAQLYNMLSCATGCNPLSYKGYGCFCGLLGSGYPVDGIDRCCKMHDWCYDAANCPMYVEYFVPYYWQCLYKRPYCALDHGNLGAPGSCADRLCECDRALSVCLKRYPCPSRRAICRSSPYRFFQNVFMLFTK